MFWAVRKKIADFIVNPRNLKPECVDSYRLNLLGDRDIENSWVAAHIGSSGGNALDFGSGGSALGLVAAMAGYDVTCIDLNKVRWFYNHPMMCFVQGDILKLDLIESSYDLVINCSAVEHVGLSGRYGVELDLEDGDLAAMKRLCELMAQHGKMLLTIPVGWDAVFAPMCRVYGQDRLPRLLSGFDVEKESYWVKDAQNRWIMCAKDFALNIKADASVPDALRAIYGLGCFVLRKKDI